MQKKYTATHFLKQYAYFMRVRKNILEDIITQKFNVSKSFAITSGKAYASSAKGEVLNVAREVMLDIHSAQELDSEQLCAIYYVFSTRINIINTIAETQEIKDNDERAEKKRNAKDIVFLLMYVRDTFISDNKESDVLNNVIAKIEDQHSIRVNNGAQKITNIDKNAHTKQSTTTRKSKRKVATTRKGRG